MSCSKLEAAKVYTTSYYQPCLRVNVDMHVRRCSKEAGREVGSSIP